MSFFWQNRCLKNSNEVKTWIYFQVDWIDAVGKVMKWWKKNNQNSDRFNFLGLSAECSIICYLPSFQLVYLSWVMIHIQKYCYVSHGSQCLEILETENVLDASCDWKLRRCFMFKHVWHFLSLLSNIWKIVPFF